MELNIQEIADSKIKAMHESGQIKAQIENDIEKMILKSVDDALNGYQIRREVEEAITSSVSVLLKDLDFTAYNGFIAQKIKDITEGVMRDDVSQKIQKVFDDMFIVKHDGIKLSEIFDKYRKWVCEDTDSSEKYERQHFTCDIETKEDGSFTWHYIKFNNEELSRGDEPQIEFRILDYREKHLAKISGLELNGESIKGKFVLGRLNEIESLLASLYFNETDIILDVDDIDDDNSFDVDD